MHRYLAPCRKEEERIFIESLRVTEELAPAVLL